MAGWLDGWLAGWHVNEAGGEIEKGTGRVIISARSERVGGIWIFRWDDGERGSPVYILLTR